MTDLVPQHLDLSKVSSLGDLLKATQPSSPPAVVLPRQVEITAEDREALQRLPEVFGRVRPTAKVDLSDEEVRSLYEERDILDRLARLVADRKEAIRTTILNALDVRDPAEVPVDKDGHFVRSASLPIPSSGKRFSWEITEGTPSIDANALLALANSEESPITHQDYLDMTVQTREVDPDAVIEKIKKDPRLLSALPIRPGAPRSALYLRKA